MNFKDHLQKMADLIVKVDTVMLEKTAGLMRHTAVVGGKVILAGNGASAAIASHVSVDLTKASRIRAINFNEADLITCFANDYGYENWIAKALDYYADPQDLIVLISCSGMSPNIINAARQAKAKGLKVVTFSGFSKENQLRGMGDMNFWVDSSEYNVVETVHQTWLLALIDLLAIEHNK